MNTYYSYYEFYGIIPVGRSFTVVKKNNTRVWIDYWWMMQRLHFFGYCFEFMEKKCEISSEMLHQEEEIIAT
jgi:hypothetical protein